MGEKSMTITYCHIIKEAPMYFFNIFLSLLQIAYFTHVNIFDSLVGVISWKKDHAITQLDIFGHI